MGKIKSYSIGILTIIIIILLLIRKCESKYNNIELRVDTIIKTINKIDTLKVIKPYKIIDTIFADSVIIKLIDSANCINLASKYYSKNVYSRELIKDSNLIVNLIDTIFENKIGGAVIDYKFKEKTIIIDKTINKKYAVGGGVLFYNNTIVPVGSFDYKNYSFDLGYNKNIYLGFKYKLKF